MLKNDVPIFIVAAVGLVIAAGAFFPPIESWGATASEWFKVLQATAFVIGGANLMTLSLKKISSQKPGWGYALIVVVSFTAMLIVGLFKIGVPPGEGTEPGTVGPALSGNVLDEQGAFAWGVNAFVNPIESTMFALLAFFVASAAFRAFRAKNLEALLLLGTAFIVLLGRTSLGFWLTSFLPEPFKMEYLIDFLADVLNKAGTRAILIGVGLGLVSTSLKIILGIDRSYLGRDQ